MNRAERRHVQALHRSLGATGNLPEDLDDDLDWMSWDTALEVLQHHATGIGFAESVWDRPGDA